MLPESLGIRVWELPQVGRSYAQANMGPGPSGDCWAHCLGLGRLHQSSWAHPQEQPTETQFLGTENVAQ